MESFDADHKEVVVRNERKVGALRRTAAEVNAAVNAEFAGKSRREEDMVVIA